MTAPSLDLELELPRAAEVRYPALCEALRGAGADDGAWAALARDLRAGRHVDPRFDHVHDELLAAITAGGLDPWAYAALTGDERYEGPAATRARLVELWVALVGVLPAPPLG